MKNKDLAEALVVASKVMDRALHKMLETTCQWGTRDGAFGSKSEWVEDKDHWHKIFGLEQAPNI